MTNELFIDIMMLELFAAVPAVLVAGWVLLLKRRLDQMSEPNDNGDYTTPPKAPLVCSCGACRRLGHPWRVGDETATTDSGRAAPVDGNAWE